MKQKEKKFTVSLQIKEHATLAKTPSYRVYFNNTLQCINDTFTCDLGHHTIKIQLLNKTDVDTEVDHQGKVLQDLAIELISLKIDQFDITHNSKECAVYVDDKGTTIENTYGYMHKNGTLTISFTCPAFYYTRNLNLIKK
jgi:hypothetical protein